MFKFLKSKIIIIYLKVLGLKVDFGAKFSNLPLLDIKGNARDIVIGKVVILGEIDIRNRESGKIIFENGCKIEAGCRFVSARNGTIKIAEGTVITTGAIINGGAVLCWSKRIFGPLLTLMNMFSKISSLKIKVLFIKEYLSEMIAGLVQMSP